MTKNIVIIGLTTLLLGGFWFYKKNQDSIRKEENATIILNKIEEVNKLILVEGNFAEVYSYKQAENIFFDLLPVEKKVIILVKAKASVGYDMKKVDFVVDKELQKVIIQNIPEEEILIEPEIQYYDIQQSQFYPIDAKDLSTINKRAIELIRKQVKNSSLPKTAENRLNEVLEELIFTGEHIGWEIVRN